MLGEPVPKRYTTNLLAYNLYLRGRYCWNKRTQAGIGEAIAYFEQAIAADPSYALAYTGLADAYALGVDYRAAPVADGMRRAREEATKALALDNSLAEAHTSLAWVTFIHDWDWETSGREFRRAIELNPRYPTARQWHSWWLAAMGRTAEAVEEGHRAALLDPASVSIQRTLGWLYYYAREPATAVEHLGRVVRMNPDSHESFIILAMALCEAGEHEAARRAVREALTLSPDDTMALAVEARIGAESGDRDASRAVLRRLEALAAYRYVSPTDLAKVHLSLGDHDRAFEAMERSCAERRGWLVYLRVEPLLDPVRGDPRFAVLRGKMKL
jgi:serine/threonine-protein kinase